jgi:hypothetical protein
MTKFRSSDDFYRPRLKFSFNRYFEKIFLKIKKFSTFTTIYEQHHDTQHNDTQHNDIQHNDTQQNDIQHSKTRHKGLICDTQNRQH